MNKLLIIAGAIALSGCLSAPPPNPSYWTIECKNAVAQTGKVVLNVRAPYDGREIVVLRNDGSMAFDGYNLFAARPKLLLKAAAEDAGLKGELEVTRLALDCRDAAAPQALVEFTFINGNKVMRSTGTAPSASNDFTEAFSKAFANAIANLK